MFSFNCISDQLNRLKEYEKDYDNLAEAEQFAISISGIKRLVPRLKSLMFKQRYKELVQASLLQFYTSCSFSSESYLLEKSNVVYLTMTSGSSTNYLPEFWVIFDPHPA